MKAANMPRTKKLLQATSSSRPGMRLSFLSGPIAIGKESILAPRFAALLSSQTPTCKCGARNSAILNEREFALGG